MDKLTEQQLIALRDEMVYHQRRYSEALRDLQAFMSSNKIETLEVVAQTPVKKD